MLSRRILKASCEGLSKHTVQHCKAINKIQLSHKAVEKKFFFSFSKSKQTATLAAATAAAPTTVTVTASPTIPAQGVIATPQTDAISAAPHVATEIVNEAVPHHVEYHLPPTFLAEHEQIMGGHVPDSMWHINAIQDFLEGIHDVLGVQWWAAISIGTIAFRLLVLPLNIGLIRNSAKLGSIRDQVVEQGEKLQQHDLPYDQKLEAAQKLDNLLKENKCHPLLNIASPLLMAPMFLSVFLSVERICLHDPRVVTEGALWFPDLSLVDPTWVLPVMSGLTWLITLELGAAPPQTLLMKQIRSILFFMVAVMVPVSGALPSGVFVYWITSNLFSICQILILQRPRVRAFLKIPIAKGLGPASPRNISL